MYQYHFNNSKGKTPYQNTQLNMQFIPLFEIDYLTKSPYHCQPQQAFNRESIFECSSPKLAFIQKLTSKFKFRESVCFISEEIGNEYQNKLLRFKTPHRTANVLPCLHVV